MILFDNAGRCQIYCYLSVFGAILKNLFKNLRYVCIYLNLKNNLSSEEEVLLKLKYIISLN